MALAEARGVPAAAKHFGITEATIERWMAEAPALSDLERARDLAQADLTAKLATGERAGIRDLAVVVGIMRDKIQRAGKGKPPSGPTAHDVRERFYDWAMDNLADVDGLSDDEVVGAYADAFWDAMGSLHSELLRRANDEPGQPHRPDMLKWHWAYEPSPHSTRTSAQQAWLDEAASTDLMDWCVAHLSELVITHGDLLTAAEEARRTEQERQRFDHTLYAERGARVRMYVEAGVSTFEEAITRAQEPVELDPDTLALLERAEAYLQEHP